jgi:hypothetical protein
MQGQQKNTKLCLLAKHERIRTYLLGGDISIDKHLLYNPAPIHLKAESKDTSNKLTSQFLYLGSASMLKKLRKKKDQ